LFERASIPTTNQIDPERISNGSFEKFSQAVVEEELHLGQCAVKWLESLTISMDATYLKDPWPKEFLDVTTNVAIMYEGALLNRVKAVFNDGSFMAAEPIPMSHLEVSSVFDGAYNSLHNVFLKYL
jgi:hypothetical protein